MKDKTAQKAILASEWHKEGGNLHETPSTKEAWILIAHTLKT
jgi:hypothetical protein